MWVYLSCETRIWTRVRSDRLSSGRLPWHCHVASGFLSSHRPWKRRRCKRTERDPTNTETRTRSSNRIHSHPSSSSPPESIFRLETWNYWLADLLDEWLTDRLNDWLNEENENKLKWKANERTQAVDTFVMSEILSELTSDWTEECKKTETE